MFFKDKKVLIIGGTGTIGKKILENILLEEPKEVRIFSRDESKHFNLVNNLTSSQKKIANFFIGDVRDFRRVSEVMKGIDYVFHTAAMKHVTYCEFSPLEAVLNNIIGTYNVINSAVNENVKKVVITSTDKAISPSNVYGATKLIAERMVQGLNRQGKESTTIFSVVRFGNVLGSRGSVIPLFISQILKDKKITVTDYSMTRFMMTLEQAALLTIKALKEASGGEVFILKMPVVSLKDLVSVILDETCKKHNMKKQDIYIEEIGLRPGEKMYEELMTIEESRIALELKDMFMIPSYNLVNIGTQVNNTKPSNYSSQNQEPISREELRKMILQENLIQ
ncbi:polysaccharide biosynthesis protein [Halalkalibacter flavus]|uniref:polysaccharide biosynthesis protein n=1 Tax=Halalkalibacter flavus TaxID=3090668 RepID=UPI002FC81A80